MGLFRLPVCLPPWRIAATFVLLSGLVSAPAVEPSVSSHSAASEQGAPLMVASPTGALEGGDRVLELGRSIEQSLAGGEAVSYRLELEAGQFARMIADQRGIDVVVSLYEPRGGKIAEVDSPNEAFGPESIVVIARTPGAYRLEVRSPHLDAVAGSFEARVTELRASALQDERRVAAQSNVMEARSLRDQGTAESQSAAVARYQTALALWRSAGEPLQEAHALHVMGLIYGDLSEYQEALDSYSQARALYRQSDDRRGEAMVLTNVGWIYGALGEHEKEIEYYQQAREASHAAGVRANDSRHLSNIGAAYASLGQYQRALDIHLQVLDMRRAADDRGGQAISLNNIANCYENLGDEPAALRYYGMALDLMPYLGSAFYTATTLNHIGVLSHELGEEREALDFFERALVLRRTIGDRSGEAATLYEMARFERDRGNLGEARDRVEAALTAVESLRADLASQGLRAAYFASVRRYHELHVGILMRLHRERPAEGFDALALQASERARARSLLEVLAEARGGIRSGVDPGLLERERELRQRISDRAARQLRLLSGAHSDEEAAAAASEIDALTSDYEEVDGRIRQSSPRYRSLTNPVPLTLEEIQRSLLDEQTLLLEFALGDERSYLWAVTPTSIESFELPGRAEIQSAALRLYEIVSARNESVPGESPERRQERLEQADAAYPAAAAAVSRMLFGPVTDQLGSQRLLIVPEGVLQYAPFAALPDLRAKDAHPLILDHEIVTLPSASVLAVLRSESEGRAPPDRGLVVLADPVFAADDPRVTGPKGGGGRTTVVTSTSEEAVRSAEESGLEDFVRLRFSRLEAEEIARYADGGTTLLALDFAASRSLATSAELSRYRIVHFATHALLNNRHTELSGVVLSLVDEEGHPQDGFLRLYDIYNLELKADLVVLSACQTALGKEIEGEGLIGLTRGFMYAGAPRVVATLWRIDDRATAELMRRLYEGVLRQGLPPAAALRAAQVSMWQEKRWQAPRFWAAFTFQGEWK